MINYFLHIDSCLFPVLVEKELLETPDHEIRSLPLRDMLRLVEYKEWMQVRTLFI
jgi:hypothetical protein